ncbi:MAG: MotA/TolQ/ExbB proton channel family protein [Bauldia sp.]
MAQPDINIFEHSTGTPLVYGVLSDRLLGSGLQSLKGLIDLGGPIMAVLIALSVVVVALTIIKLFQFAARGVGRRKTAERAVEAWTTGDRELGYELARSERSPVATSLAHAMRGVSKAGPRDALVREDIERVTLAELDRLRSALRPIEVVGQIAPLLGLLGTIMGMISTFQQMQQAGASVDPSIFAGGIWAALFTTGFGLAIAIVTTATLSWLEQRIDGERVAIERLVTAVLTDKVTDEASEERRVVPVARLVTPAHAH